MNKSDNSEFDGYFTDSPPEDTLIIANIRGFGKLKGIIKREVEKSPLPFFDDIHHDAYFVDTRNIKYDVKLIEKWWLLDNLCDQKVIGEKTRELK